VQPSTRATVLAIDYSKNRGLKTQSCQILLAKSAALSRYLWLIFCKMLICRMI
jgi:hypothetical protein